MSGKRGNRVLRIRKLNLDIQCLKDCFSHGAAVEQMALLIARGLRKWWLPLLLFVDLICR